MAEELPPLVTRFLADLSDLRDATTVEGPALVRAFEEEARRSFSDGKGVGAAFGRDLGDGIQDAIPPGFGRRIGEDFTTGIKEALPPSLTDLIPPAPSEPARPKREGKKSGAAFAAAFTAAMKDTVTPSTLLDDSVIRGLDAKGKDTGDKFAFTFGAGVKERLQADSVASIIDGVVPAATTAGDRAGFNFTQAMGGRVRGELPEQVEKPLEDSGKKGGERGGKEAGKAFAEGVSPLLLGAFTAAATVGPAAILAGTAGAVVGIGALISHSNADIQAEYRTLAGDVGREMTSAVAPLAPAIEASMVQADTAIGKLGPTLKQTFADAEPDVSALTNGVVGLAGNALPGLENAIDRSRGIVAGFAGSLPTLGGGVGRFFTGLTTDAQSTQRGIVDFVGVTSNALGTLGHVAGSASAALSTDFDAIQPALNGALSVIDKVSSPAVIGGLIGLGGAMKFDPAISGGLQKISNGFTAVASKADGARGLLGKAGTAAEGAAGGFGKMADVMGGPWGIAIGAGIGALGGLVSSLGQVQVSASDFSAAVAQDNGVVGASTTAVIQNEIAKLDLTQTQKDLGVSQATLIEYAAGEKDATDQVNAALAAKQAALDRIAPATEHYGRAIGAQQAAAREEQNNLANAKQRLDAMTSAIQQAIRDQNDQNQAYLAATRSTGIFAGMVDTATTALEVQANQSGINTIAALQLSGAHSTLAQKVADEVSEYQLASDQASAYKTVLDAVFGKYQSYSDAVADFTLALKVQGKELTSGKNAIDLTTEAGAKNEKILSGMATKNHQVAESLLAETGNQQQANEALQAGAQKIDALAKSAGFTDSQIAQLNKDLYGTANIKDIRVTVGADTSGVYNGVNEALRWINGQYASVSVSPRGPLGTGQAVPAFDLGGWVNAPAGAPMNAIVHGREYVLSEDMLAGRQAVDPRVLGALRPDAGFGAPVPAYAGHASFSSPMSHATNVTIIVNAGTVLSHQIQFQQAVATAMAQWGSRVPNQNMSWQSVRGLKSA